MIYDIRHVTTYNYASAVSFARCALRLTPIDGGGQRLISHRIEIKPKPAERAVRTEFFGIVTESVVIDTPHRALRIDARARVEVNRPAVARDTASADWETVREAGFAASSGAAASPANFIFASPLAPLRPKVTDYARPSFPPGRGVLAGAVDLMRRIYSDFTYQSGATTIATPLDTVLAERRGVCQDFAHLMIAGLRGLGLPAAYVSGYLRTTPPPGQKRLEGADATHAWASVWCGEALGWIGFDPTNDLLVANDHIVLAVGRDFSDVSPVDGVIVGSRKQRLGVAVDVIPVTPGEALSPQS